MSSGAAARLSAQVDGSRSITATAVAAPDSYTNYTPYMCAQVVSHELGAGRKTDRVTWNDRWAPTPETERRDSVVRAERMAIASRHTRDCLSKFSLTSTPASQQFGVGLAWLTIDDTAKATEVFTHILRANASAPVLDRAWILNSLVTAYSGGQPGRLDVAFQYMKALDALSAEAAPYQLRGHNTLYKAASTIDSIPLMAEQADAALKLRNQMTGDALRDWLNDCAQAEVNRADVELRKGNYPVAVDMLKKALAALGPLSEMTHMMLGDKYSTAMMYGTPATPMKATFVYWPGEKTPRTTIDRPAKGRVSVLYSTYKTPDLGFDTFEDVERIVRNYGDRIDVTFATTLDASYAGRLISVDSQSTLAQEFFQGLMKVKVPVVVSSLKKIGVSDDGRWIRENNPNIYFQQSIVVDKKGKIRSVDAESVDRNLHLIAELLRESD